MEEDKVSTVWTIRRYTSLIADIVSLAENETDKIVKDYMLGYAETLCGMLANKVKELRRSAKEPGVPGVAYELEGRGIKVIPGEDALERDNRLEKKKDE